MNWSTCPNAAVFLERRQAYLREHESLNCLAWAATHRALSHTSAQPSHTFMTYGVGPTAAAHAFISHADRGIVLSRMPERASLSLADFIDRQSITLTLVEGPEAPTQAFVKRWSETHRCNFEHVMDQGLYEIRTVQMPDLAGGRLIQAGVSERDTLRDMVEGFAACFPDQPLSREATEARVARYLDLGRAYLWRDARGELVSMAVIVRETPHTASISWVYTPPQHQRRGHASRVVAALSQAQLDAGKRACNLYTDLSNPTSNHIYSRIGYKKIAESIRVRLVV